MIRCVEEANEKTVVHLPAKAYGTNGFNTSDDRRDLFVAEGRQAAADYLEGLKNKRRSLDPPGLPGYNWLLIVRAANRSLRPDSNERCQEPACLQCKITSPSEAP